MTAKKYNVGIIGYGWVSSAHIAAINATPLAQVKAIYSSRKLDSADMALTKYMANFRCLYNATDGGPVKVTLVGAKSGAAY